MFRNEAVPCRNRRIVVDAMHASMRVGKMHLDKKKKGWKAKHVDHFFLGSCGLI